MEIAGIFLRLMQRLGIPVIIVKNEDEPEQYGIRIVGEKGQWDGIARCFEEERLFLFYVNYQVSVPPARREQVCCELMRINAQMKCGGFCLDEETGMLTARVSQFITGSEEEQEATVEHVVRLCGVMADSYFERIMKHIFTD